jgi:DNA-binding CsgD family transcriptional regulator
VTGYSNEAIALDLDISFHSVRTYRKRAYAKLNVTSQNELFAHILNTGIPDTIPRLNQQRSQALPPGR